MMILQAEAATGLYRAEVKRDSGSWFSFHRCNNSSFSWWPNTDVKKRSAQFINHIMLVFQILEPKDIRSWLIRFLPNCLETLPFNKADHSTWIGVGSMWPVLWCHALGNVYWMAELTYNYIITIIIIILWRAIKCLHRIIELPHHSPEG